MQVGGTLILYAETDIITKPKVAVAILGTYQFIQWADAVGYSQVMWMRRSEFSDASFKYRAAGKIAKHLYHELYHLSKVTPSSTSVPLVETRMSIFMIL